MICDSIRGSEKFPSLLSILLNTALRLLFSAAGALALVLPCDKANASALLECP